MERTTPPVRMPDAINCSKQRDFTQMPTNVLRNPDISAKAKTILGILLSNKTGWQSHISTLTGMMKEGVSAVNVGLQELEKLNYLKRYRYRDIETKRWIGSFWAYTDFPGKFRIRESIKELTN